MKAASEKSRLVWSSLKEMGLYLYPVVSMGCSPQVTLGYRRYMPTHVYTGCGALDLPQDRPIQVKPVIYYLSISNQEGRWWWRFRPFLGFSAALACSSGLQGGYLGKSKSQDSITIDMKPQMWQLTSILVCCGLVSVVTCLFLVVAISAVSWLFWRSGVLQRSAGWLSE